MRIKIVVISFITLIVIAVGVGWLYLCPLLYVFPHPTGHYSVGYSNYHWQDLQRKVTIECNVEIFYPSAMPKNVHNKFAYQPHKLKALEPIYAADSWLPRFVWHCMVSNMMSYAEPDAVIAATESAYPVILYLPGIGSEDLHNLYLEELASHGYVIAAIEPPQDILVTVFPGNNIITLDPELKKAITENNRDVIYAYRNNAHERWSNYILFTIEKLHALNGDPLSPFYKKLDLNLVGLLGHSHGGAVVTDFCQKNKLCKAGVNMDGWTKTYNTGQAFDAPFLFLLSETGQMPEMQPLFDNNVRPDFKKVTIHGAGHGAFSDGVLTKQPIGWLTGVVTTTKTSKVIKAIKDNLVTFFDKYLKSN